MHTKEPWLLDESINFVYRITNKDNDEIARCPRSGIAEMRTQANALLIAQAPAMLRRLESAARWVGKLAADNDTNYIGERAHQELERINAVIAKARGE